MSKKTRKKRGEGVGYCRGCGKRLRAHDPACTRCGRRSPLFQAKGARPYLVKGGSVTPLRQRQRLCWNGHAAPAAHRYCTRCGEPVGVSRQQSMAAAQKALMSPGSYWDQQAARSSDPGERQVLEKMAKSQPGYRGNDPLTIALALGYRSVEDAARHENGIYRQMFEQAWLNPNPTGGFVA